MTPDYYILMTPPCMRAVVLTNDVVYINAYPAFSTMNTPPYTALLKSMVLPVILNSQSEHLRTPPNTDYML
jgi:hypothetical protein